MEPKDRKEPTNMKKLIAFILCGLSVCSLAACASKTATSGNAAIPNPFVDCATLADAAMLTGFDIIVPDSVDGFDTRTIQVMDNKMIQVIYTKGDNNLLIRKQAGSDDISGDYSQYSETNTVTLGTLQVTMKGENGMVCLATWADGGYMYAIDAQDVPWSSDTISALIGNVK